MIICCLKLLKAEPENEESPPVSHFHVLFQVFFKNTIFWARLALWHWVWRGKNSKPTKIKTLWFPITTWRCTVLNGVIIAFHSIKMPRVEMEARVLPWRGNQGLPSGTQWGALAPLLRLPSQFLLHGHKCPWWRCGQSGVVLNLESLIQGDTLLWLVVYRELQMASCKGLPWLTSSEYV